ncbi:hypothetical protein B0H13DRAFT_2567604 [Mycena leptocephala]|nr:hypothetical protein B0H13DRAFT_2567604 [Mycena leptocephala]
MPRQPTTETRLNTIVAYLTPAPLYATHFKDSSLIDHCSAKCEEEQRRVCSAHGTHPFVIYAIINIHLKSETPGSLHPSVLEQIGKFTGYIGSHKTLQKIHAFVEAQQDGSKIKSARDCQSGLEEALEVFETETGMSVFNSVDEMKQKTENMYNELLELIQPFQMVQIYLASNRSQNSSNSFSMLPSKPSIFHGRESELKHIIETLSQDIPRVAILGGGGMGKTSLARAVLHHPDIADKFEHRYFVSAESATSTVDLAALIGLHVGLNPGKDLTRLIVQYLSTEPPCLLILDNLETPWESIHTRGGVEDFLSLLTDLPHLALMVCLQPSFNFAAAHIQKITMRGAERPAKVAWTHPFLPPLQPLSDGAARQTFIDITDHQEGEEENMKQLLRFTDNMPLAVDLIAHLVDYEGHANVLARWETEKTSLLSAGHDRRSNLDASIRVSLSSPRITSGAKDLLSLLSILPDGLSDVELIQSNLPIQAIRSCKATLIATSLAYIDNKKRLRSLVPIREHIQKFSPPSESLMDQLRKHFHSLLDLYKKYNGAQLSSIVLHRDLHKDNPDVADSIHCIINFNSFHRVTGRGGTILMEQIPAVLSKLGDPRLEVHFTTDILKSERSNPIFSPELLIAEGISNCNEFNDPVLESTFYVAAGYHHFYCNRNHHMALELLARALKLSTSCGDTDTQCSALRYLAETKRSMGDPAAAQTHVHQARWLANLTGNLYQEAHLLRVLAQCTCQLGDYRNSIAHLHRAKEILELCGLAGGGLQAVIKTHEAEVHLLKSEYTEARSIYARILKLTDQDPFMKAIAQFNIAHIDVMLGTDAEEVQHNLNETKTTLSTTKYLYGATCCEMVFGDLKLRGGDTCSAEQILQDCLNLTWGNETEAVSFCLERFADRGRWHPVEHAHRWPVVYLGHAHQAKEKLAVHKALLFLGDVFISQGDDDTAYSLFTAALEGFNCMDVHRSRAQCLLRLGDLAHKKGDVSRAVDHWTTARPLFERSSQTKDVAQIDARLAELERNWKVLLHLSALNPQEKIVTESSVEVEEIGKAEGAGQNVPERIMIADM